MPNLRMSNSTLSGGTAFEMNANSLNFSWNNFIETEQMPGKANTSGLDVRLPEGKYLGHAAPSISFDGFVDTTKSDPTYISGIWGNVPYITLSGLGQLARLGSGYLYFPPVLQFVGSPVDRQNLNTGSISVMINSIKLNPNVQFFNAYSGIIPYNITLTLVSGPV